MATTGFFNPLTGFQLMFPRPLDEAAARERLLTDRREGRASQERMADQDFAAKISQLLTSDKMSSDRSAVMERIEKYKANKAVEAAGERGASVSYAFLRQILNDADGAERYADRENDTWNQIQNFVDEVNAAVAEAGQRRQDRRIGNLWFKGDESDETLEARKKMAFKAAKDEIPKNFLKFIRFDNTKLAASNTAEKPKPFNKPAYIQDRMRQSGIDFSRFGKFGAELGSSPTDANNTTSPGPVKGGRGSAPSPFYPTADDVIPGPITHAPGVAPSGDEDQSFIGALNRADDLTSGRANIPFGQVENLGTIVRIGNNVVLVGQDGSIQPISSGFGRALGLGFGNTFSPGTGVSPTVSPFGQ